MWKTGLIELKENVYGYVQKGGSWFVGNSGIVIGKKWNIVIDSLSTGDQVRPYLEAIGKVTNNPVYYLVNTHLHADHVWTNHFFKGAFAIAHDNNRKSVINEKAEGIMEHFAKLMPEMNFSESRYTPQDITISQNMTIFQDDREIRIIHLPKSHTVSDLIVHLPQERVVYTGDILFSAPCTPFAMAGSITGNIDALEYLKKLNAEIYVSGHGPIVYDVEQLTEAIDYLKFIRTEAKRLYEAGQGDYIKAAKSIDLGIYAKWGDRERVIGNFARAYSELRGEPIASPLPNTMELFEIMIKYGRENKNMDRKE